MNWPRSLPEFANWLRRPTQNSQIGGFATSIRRLETELPTNQSKHNRPQHRAAMLRVRMLTRSDITTRASGALRWLTAEAVGLNGWRLILSRTRRRGSGQSLAEWQLRNQAPAIGGQKARCGVGN